MPFPALRSSLSLALLYFALGTLAPAHAQALLRGETELIQALRTEPPCCVIDARSEANQRKQRLDDALRYRPGLSIVPTASVVVVADHDLQASQVAADLAKQHPGKVIHAVKGGVTTWKAVLKSLEQTSASKAPQAPQAGAGISFVIPHNTCETGTPLQILNSKPSSKPLHP